jgi:hypothetical protein
MALVNVCYKNFKCDLLGGICLFEKRVEFRIGGYVK